MRKTLQKVPVSHVSLCENGNFSQHVLHGLEWFYLVHVSETKASSLCFA
jgi:hypothetical protein